MIKNLDEVFNLLVIHKHKPYFEEYQDFLEKYEEITGGKNDK